MPQSNHHRATSATALNKKRLSGNGRPVLIKKNTSSKSLGRKRDSVEYNSQGDEEDMSTSFLQFCATCEKQIVVPNAAILYCSERCRRSDSGSSAPLPMSFKAHSTEPQKPQSDLIPPMSPTSIQTTSPFRTQHICRASDTEMSRRPDSNEAIATTVYSSQTTSESRQTARPQSSRPNTATPSLSYSPSSCASSFTFSQSLGNGRHTSNKSIELVTPTAACPTAPASIKAHFEDTPQLNEWKPISDAEQLVFEDEDELGETMTYGKRSSTAGIASASSSLKHLLQNSKRKPEKVK